MKIDIFSASYAKKKKTKKNAILTKLWRNWYANKLYKRKKAELTHHYLTENIVDQVYCQKICYNITLCY